MVAAAAWLVSLDVELDDAAADEEPFVADVDEVVVLLPEEQPVIAIPAASIAATSWRWVMKPPTGRIYQPETRIARP
ncbi:hypothetical protein A5647_06865 [Mycobacterium sp. 1100029.7]|nr:hypothetical protein A5647_06865 [Mycobacterium sp. 1100029.7]